MIYFTIHPKFFFLVEDKNLCLKHLNQMAEVKIELSDLRMTES